MKDSGKMTIKQEIQKHIKDGKLDNYGALLLTFTIIATINHVLNATLQDENKENPTHQQN